MSGFTGVEAFPAVGGGEVMGTDSEDEDGDGAWGEEKATCHEVIDLFVRVENPAVEWGGDSPSVCARSEEVSVGSDLVIGSSYALYFPSEAVVRVGKVDWKNFNYIRNTRYLRPGSSMCFPPSSQKRYGSLLSTSHSSKVMLDSTLWSNPIYPSHPLEYDRSTTHGAVTAGKQKKQQSSSQTGSASVPTPFDIERSFFGDGIPLANAVANIALKDIKLFLTALRLSSPSKKTLAGAYTQYRMPVALGQFISQQIYQSKLESVHDHASSGHGGGESSLRSFMDAQRGCIEKALESQDLK
ncbi:hypothetical protein FA13DRAFT_1721159 [Coprinellus micaceus]|uniref:Uncharacterized protein n=1 Tax=Coprinellus micaceus TaxID=71717 RepID=A0A4Y7S333_COPMI|nr:hypothetical protein FA13DRAFT_1721159 [Coprinellus micaceus]